VLLRFTTAFVMCSERMLSCMHTLTFATLSGFCLRKHKNFSLVL
jgi:hypothetical protein